MLSGAIGLQIIARRLGVELGERQFSSISGVDERELSAKEIKSVATSHGLICKAIKTNISGLGEAAKKQPVLCALSNNRYVIVIKVESGDEGPSQVTVIDPKATNPKPEIIDEGSFVKHWSQAGLIFRRSRKLEKNTGTISVSAIIDDLLEDKWVLAQLLLIIFFINLFGLAPIIFLITVLDKVVNYESYSTLYVIASGVVIAHVFNFILSRYKSSIINLAASKIEAKYGMQIFRQLINLPSSTFEKQSGQLTTLGQTLNNIRSLLIFKFLGIITDITSVIVFTPILIFYSPVLGAIVIGFCLLNSLYTAFHARRSNIVSQDLALASNARQGVLNAVGDNFIDIKRLGLENDIISEWKTAEGNFLRSNDVTQTNNTTASEFGTLLNNLLTVVVLFVGVHLVFEGSLSAGVLIGVNMLIGKIFRPTQAVVEFPKEVKKLSNMIENFAVAASLSQERINSGNFHNIVGSTSFQEVSVSNDTGTPLLNNVSFSVNVNDTVGICADNPKTASAIAHLLQGLYRPSAGSIFVDGNDLSTFNLQHLRANVALVDRTNHFFEGSLRDNFQKVLPNANNDRISWACKIADFTGALERFNLTLDSQIEEARPIWDEDFKMKLALARAMIRNPKILILDGVFALLSSNSILQFRKNFSTLAKSRTIILISKDIHNLTICKNIFIFNSGKLSQSGPTSQLFEEPGPAQELLKKQLSLISPELDKHFEAIVKGITQ